MTFQELNEEMGCHPGGWFGTPEGIEAMRQLILAAPLEFIRAAVHLLMVAPPEVRKAAQARLKELGQPAICPRPGTARRWAQVRTHRMEEGGTPGVKHSPATVLV